VLLALRRRRSLLTALAIVVALAAFAAPALAGVHAHCLDVTDQHCTLGFHPGVPVLVITRLGLAQLVEPILASLLVTLPILKVPLVS
jgi:hypothetical protein